VVYYLSNSIDGHAVMPEHVKDQKVSANMSGVYEPLHTPRHYTANHWILAQIILSMHVVAHMHHWIYFLKKKLHGLI
jgi:hypothetical protein